MIKKKLATKENRITELKVAGQMIIDKAEEIIGSNELCQGHKITIELLPDKAPIIKTEIITLVDVYGVTGRYEVINKE